MYICGNINELAVSFLLRQTNMSRVSDDWVTQKLEQLEVVTPNYSNKEKVQVRLSYLYNLLSRLSEFDIDKDDILIGNIENVINSLPEDLDELHKDSYQAALHDLEFDIKKRFNLIPKSFYRKDLNPFSITKLVVLIMSGITIFFISMLLKNPPLTILIGVPLIILINSATSIILDKKAQKVNRVL